MRFHFIKNLFAGITALCAVSVAAHVVFAQEATSGGFLMRNSTVNTLGGSSTSTSFSTMQSGDQVGGGESTSTNFQLNAGFLYFDSYTPMQQNWRWYDDETNETPTTPLAGENVAPANISTSNIIKLRVSVVETADIGATQVKYRLQYSTSSDFSSAVYVAETLNCQSNSAWCYTDGAGVDNATISTKVISDSSACASSAGVGCGTHNEFATTSSTFTHQKSAITEFEFTLKESGSAGNTVYFFRLVSATSGAIVPLNSGKSNPSLSSAAGTLSFTIGGIASSTFTSGTTTTRDSTSLSVPFGALLSGDSALAAQRLTVSTNASQGYKIFSYATQGFVGSGVAEIPAVSGTNSSPLGWTSGCSNSATGCYGYHTNEAVLFGGSTRFAADDTYAQFSTTTPDEVAYSVGPVSSKATDIVYKTEIHALQTADSYTTNVVYIVVATF